MLIFLHKLQGRCAYSSARLEKSTQLLCEARDTSCRTAVKSSRPWRAGARRKRRPRRVSSPNTRHVGNISSCGYILLHTIAQYQIVVHVCSRRRLLSVTHFLSVTIAVSQSALDELFENCIFALEMYPHIGPSAIETNNEPKRTRHTRQSDSQLIPAEAYVPWG